MANKIRWRFRFHDGRPVRVLQYWEPEIQWQDVLVADYEDRDRSDAFAERYLATGPLPKGVYDFCEYKRRRDAKRKVVPIKPR
jgi:hypothetical protein